MGFGPEERETLRRADERFQVWRMFEDRHHPTPKRRGRSRAATGRRDPNLPRPNATTATAEADPKFHECLAKGGTRWEAFKQHKSRLRTAAYQEYYGLEPTPPESRESSPPPMMLQGPMHRRLVMSRSRALAERGFIPTNEELAQAVSMEHLADLVAARARATIGQGETDAESSEEEGRAQRRSRSRG